MWSLFFVAHALFRRGLTRHLGESTCDVGTYLGHWPSSTAHILHCRRVCPRYQARYAMCVLCHTPDVDVALALLLFAPNPMAGPCVEGTSHAMMSVRFPTKLNIIFFQYAATNRRCRRHHYQYDKQTVLHRPEPVNSDFVGNSKFLTNSEFEGRISSLLENCCAHVANALQLSPILTEIY